MNSWGTAEENNYEARVQDTLKYGPERVKLANYVRTLLDNAVIGNQKLVWYLDTGNLMGAFRDGKMVKHDDDFDIGVLMKSVDGIKELFEYLKKANTRKDVDMVLTDTYCKKIEVFMPEFGFYNLTEEFIFHNVTVDIQLYLQQEGSNDVLFVYSKNDLNKYIDIKLDMILPLSEIVYETFTYNCPNDPERYLTAHYGYIGPNAVYNHETRKYEPKKESVSVTM